MEIRPYKSLDFDTIKTWIKDKRSHALWCADLIPYPLLKHSFEKTLKELSLTSKDTPFVAINDDGVIVGFFCYSFVPSTKEGKLKFIIISPEFRGKGYGKKMVTLAIKNAFCNSRTETIQLNVFCNNEQAKKCYLRAGFSERLITEDAFCFNNEKWARCNMVIKK